MLTVYFTRRLDLIKAEETLRGWKNMSIDVIPEWIFHTGNPLLEKPFWENKQNLYYFCIYWRWNDGSFEWRDNWANKRRFIPHKTLIIKTSKEWKIFLGSFFMDAICLSITMKMFHFIFGLVYPRIIRRISLS